MKLAITQGQSDSFMRILKDTVAISSIYFPILKGHPMEIGFPDSSQTAPYIYSTALKHPLTTEWEEAHFIFTNKNSSVLAPKGWACNMSQNHDICIQDILKLISQDHNGPVQYLNVVSYCKVFVKL